jgi:hypothetical protein
MAKNSIKTNIQVQTSKSLNRVKQDMLLVPKTIRAQYCCTSSGKMKAKKVTNKSMMDDLVLVKRQSFPSAIMSFFCYQSPK